MEHQETFRKETQGALSRITRENKKQRIIKFVIVLSSGEDRYAIHE